MKTLKALVRVVNPETQEAETFRPGDDLPDWFYEKVTNPAAWSDEDAPSPNPAPTSGDVSSEMTREQLLEAAQSQFNLVPGEDFPKSAGKDVILAAIAHAQSGSGD